MNSTPAHSLLGFVMRHLAIPNSASRFGAALAIKDCKTVAEAAAKLNGVSEAGC
jgi:hypothetical protein